jgi:chitin-binding protein
LGYAYIWNGSRWVWSVVAKLSWNASIDNVGVTQYQIYRNGTLLAVVNGTTLTYRDRWTVAGGGTYSYFIVAKDAAGNLSYPSNLASVVR